MPIHSVTIYIGAVLIAAISFIICITFVFLIINCSFIPYVDVGDPDSHLVNAMYKHHIDLVHMVYLLVFRMAV